MSISQKDKSRRACTSNGGTLVANYRYDAFGNTLASSGNYASLNKYRFSTKPLDEETPSAKLYYYGYRFYSPDLGRFISRDPIEEEGGINLYGFVGNSPMSKWDLLGMKTKNCTTVSKTINFNVGFPTTRIGLFDVNGSIGVSLQVQKKNCDECCDGKWSSKAYEEGTIAAEITLNASSTLGIDREYKRAGYNVSLFAGIKAFFKGSGSAVSAYESHCNGSKKHSSYGSISIGGGITGGANFGIIKKNTTLIEFGGYMTGFVGTTGKFKIDCDGGDCRFVWLGKEDDYGTVTAVGNFGLTSFTKELWKK
jgi:RHS repeat-associated protein